MEPIRQLRLQGVSRRFGATAALESFDLEINGGTFITLLGPSGCGKTTALNCLAGLLELSAGEIILNGRAIQDVPAEKRGFGMVFQNYALFPHLTVFRNVSYGLEIRSVSKAERERRVRRALEQVRLSAFEKRFPAQLSGGQQQRLAIARTIVLEPNLLLLDEPLSNLDANLRSEMRIEIKRLHEELGLTTVYVTHDQLEALSMSDLIVVMCQGAIEQVGTPQEIYSRPKSLYVATFMGYANQFPVTLVAREGGYFVVKGTSGLTLLASTTSEEQSQWQLGQQVIACFRPDDVQFELATGQNNIRGHMRLAEYMGKSFEVLVDLDGSEGTRFLVQSQQVVESGSSITFGIRPERLLLFPFTGSNMFSAPIRRLESEPVAEGKGA